MDGMQMKRERNVKMRFSLSDSLRMCPVTPALQELIWQSEWIQSLSSALPLYETGKLCSSFHLSLHRSLTVSPSFLLYPPYIALFSQCEQRLSLHSHFFLSPIFPLISLFFALCSHSHRLELTKIELCLLIVKLIWLTFLCGTQKVYFWRICCQAPKWQ